MARGSRGSNGQEAYKSAKRQMLEKLAQVASARDLITYSDLVACIDAMTLDPRSSVLNSMLSEISEEEHAAGRGMLSAVVVTQEGGMPGTGFFELAHRLGRRGSDREELWVAELHRVHRAHPEHPPMAPAPTTRRSTALSANFQDETELHRLGYNVSELSRWGRWDVLTRTAVPQLGLRAVVETIAGLIRVRKLAADGATRYERAIGEWEYDLSRLRMELFDGSFDWPVTEV
jgi:hypothetical protein